MVNGIRTGLVAVLPPDADVVQFLSFNPVDGVVFAAAPVTDFLAQSAPGTMPETFGPHSAWDARSPALPLLFTSSGAVDEALCPKGHSWPHCTQRPLPSRPHCPCACSWTFRSADYHFESMPIFWLDYCGR